jgi:hypothetical protein
MRITRTHVRNLDLYVHPDLRDQFVRVVSPMTELSADKLSRIGLDQPLAEGESYLPPSVGRTSRFNAEGKWVTLRDHPKEKRYIRTIHWTWKQFTGGGGTEDVEDSRDIYRMCYPRDIVLPPSEEVFGFPIDGVIYAATESVSLPGESERVRHQVNLMLELFKECEVVRADGTSASPARTHRRWTFLPSGPFKKGDITQSLEPVLSRLGVGDKIILSERQDFLTELDPQEVAQGQGGFNDYLAYVFPQYGRVVLESLRRDNAIYVFKSAWESFSRLTKRQILDSGVHDARVLHTKGWQGRLMEILRSN